MKCVTCGKTVKRGDAVCGFCGAMADESVPKISTAKPGEFTLPSMKEQKTAPPQDVATEEHDWPELEPEGKERLPEGGAEQGEETATPHPKPPAWVRFISPLFFVVLFLVTQFWLRDSDRPGTGRTERAEQAVESTPSLRQGGFAGSAPDGGAVETRTVFSLQDDRQIVFISTWRGSPSGHSYSVEWHAPDGATHESSNVMANTAPGGEGFSVIATLELNAALPRGEWRVEITQDEEIVSRYAFRLNE